MTTTTIRGLAGIVVLGAWLSAAGGGQVPAYLHPDGKWHWYTWNTTHVAWTDARAAAEAQDGYLATITSEAENTFIRDVAFGTEFPGPPHTLTRYWIGGHHTGAGWSWVTGEPWVYQNWATSRNSGAVLFHWQGDEWNGKWDAAEKWNDFRYIVEHESVAPPAEMPVLLFDDFDDGNFNEWTVQDPYTGGASPLTPAIVPSPQGHSLRGVGSGYSGSGEAAYLARPLPVTTSGEIAIEMRAKSGPAWPNHSYVMLWSGDDYYRGTDNGESARTADFVVRVDGAEQTPHRLDLGDRAHEWHDFSWRRDADGWWSLSIDGVVEAANFYQDDRLVSFDRVALAVVRDQSEIEWVRITGQPATMPHADAGGPYAIYPGDILVLDATASIAGPDEIVHYEWDLDGDGVFETDVVGWDTFLAPYDYVESLGLDPGRPHDIGLQITDSRGLTDTAETTLTIIATPGDGNLDGAVNDYDLNILLSHWNLPGGWGSGDFSHDGFVADADLSLLLKNWTGSAFAVPEPICLALIVAGLLPLARRRPPGRRGGRS